MSEHKNVFAAIAAVQAKLDPIVADDEADAGKYTYRYATLPQVWRHIRPLLAEAGLAVVYETESANEKLSVRLRVKHPASDTEHAIVLPLVGYTATMQGLGGVLTYARRYLLHLAFGLAIEGEDKDAGQGPQPKARPARQAQQPQRSASAHDGAKLTAAQVQLLDGSMTRRARELGEGIAARDIAREIQKAHGWKTLEDCPAAELNEVMAEIRGWQPPAGEPEQGGLL